MTTCAISVLYLFIFANLIFILFSNSPFTTSDCLPGHIRDFCPAFSSIFFVSRNARKAGVPSASHSVDIPEIDNGSNSPIWFVHEINNHASKHKQGTEIKRHADEYFTNFRHFLLLPPWDYISNTENSWKKKYTKIISETPLQWTSVARAHSPLRIL